MAKDSVIQQMLDTGRSQFGIEVLEKSILSGDISDSLDSAIGKTKLQKKIPIKMCKRLIKDGLLKKTVEEYQEAGICRAGPVGSGKSGRKKGPAFYCLNEEGKKVYPKLYFKGGGTQSEVQKEIREELTKILESKCLVEQPA